MNRLRPFYELTEALGNLLEQEITSVNRDVIISEVNRFIQQRANLLMEIYPPFTEEEKCTGNQIVKKNRMVQSKTNLIFSDLKQEMKQIQQKKSRVKLTSIHIDIFALRMVCFWTAKSNNPVVLMILLCFSTINRHFSSLFICLSRNWTGYCRI